MKFVRSFFNRDGQEVAGIWYDEESHAWRVSTIPVERFATEDEAPRKTKRSNVLKGDAIQKRVLFRFTLPPKRIYR